MVPIVPNDAFYPPSYSERDPDAPLCYADLFPPNYTPFPNITPQQQVTLYSPNILSTPLDPPPPMTPYSLQQHPWTLLKPLQTPRRTLIAGI